VTPVAAGAVIAAGDGARLATLGRPKALVEVAGMPLVERVLANFRAAGISGTAVLFNERDHEPARFVAERFPGFATVLRKTTPHSLESFRTVLHASPPGRVLVATVDTVCAEEDFVAFVRAAERVPAGETVLAVTPLVADEKPLWVQAGAGGRVLRVGGEATGAVTAGYYLVSANARARAAAAPPELGRLREFLAWLCDSGEPMRAIPIANAVDVDRPEDVRLAESLLGARTPAAAGPARGGRA
jgi:NDP-sugar pyrophosphorylase family protein